MCVCHSAITLAFRPRVARRTRAQLARSEAAHDGPPVRAAALKQASWNINDISKQRSGDDFFAEAGGVP
ncbi:hypothetical protein DF153_05235 [Burkholderia cenocepacia]|nr:hypothetical protein DF152_16250 [Burkholderia cenocepacia]RQU28485.1 hypothetical protein DF153_05235 [Burkholderia cenocepacia]